MYTPPTHAELTSQIITRIESGLGQTIPILPIAFVRVLAAALAGPLALAYRFIAWAYRQIFPQTSDAEALAYLGDQFGLTRRPAVAAELTITISGDNGTEIPAGTLWTIGSQVYEQDSLAIIVTGTASAQVEALVAGDAGNAINATPLTPSSPLVGVTDAVVASTITTGEDAELLEDFRARVIQRMREQPQGGSAADYVRWALEVPGIVSAYAYRMGTPTAPIVNVYPLIAKTGDDRIPDAPKLAEVQTYLQDPIRRPLCATVYAAAALERVVNLTITSVSPSDAATRANIESAIETYLWARYPKQYTDEPASTETVSVAAIWSAIHAAGASAASIVMSIAGIGTVTTYTLPAGELATLGVITWA